MLVWGRACPLSLFTPVKLNSPFLYTMWKAMLGTSLGRFFPQLTHPPPYWLTHQHSSLLGRTLSQCPCRQTGMWGCAGITVVAVVAVVTRGLGCVISRRSHFRLGPGSPAFRGRHYRWCNVSPARRDKLSVRESILSNSAGNLSSPPSNIPRSY